MTEFLENWFEGRTERQSFLESNLKANINVSLSEARLVGSALTDFKTVMDKILVGATQDVEIDLTVKIEDLIVKVIKKILNMTNFGVKPILQWKR